MVNVRRLKKGDIVRTLVDNKSMGLKANDTLRVIEVGYSSWDRLHYADCKTDKGFTLEIMKNHKEFELV